MAIRIFLTLNIIATIFLTLSMTYAIRLKLLMGKGKDTKTLPILFTVIIVNLFLVLQLFIGGLSKRVHDYQAYVQTADVILAVSGIFLFAMVRYIYKDYSKLIKKLEPEL